MTDDSPKSTESSQIDGFKEAARKLGCNEDEAAFKAKLAVIARQKPKSASKAPTVECAVIFLSSAAGGRTAPPIVNGGGYRPLLQLADTDSAELFGVLFQAGPVEIEFGSEATVELLPVIYPNPAYDALQPSAQFIIREGEKVVGKGHVVGRTS